MLFSSTLFLYLFLPLCLLGYYFAARELKNYFLLAASMLFFAWGGVGFTSILVASIVMNYGFGLLIQWRMGRSDAKVWITLGVGANIALLAVFKYVNFFLLNLNLLGGWLGLPALPQTDILLPIGISFYTFHSLSYLVDIYRGKTTAQRNIFDLALYITMFSQLIAGPIIRYSDVWQQLRGREHTLAKFSSGVERFLIGLGKKVLLANVFARVADDIFAHPSVELNILSAWLGMICYSLQIYCDFAGYSDMAIGLGRMFGFEFMENFDFPYRARSVKEFWRRWHISLSSFFRDYVYIPLGGNRGSGRRTYLNLLAVFLLTGIWHGANWTFVVWGLMHGAFMLLERAGWENRLQRMWKPLASTYTLLVVMLAWVLFRADSITYAVDFWAALVKFKFGNLKMALFMHQLTHELWVAMLIALVGAFGGFAWARERLHAYIERPALGARVVAYGYHIASAAGYAAILLLSTMYLVAGSYNPFIYYRF